MGKKKIGLATIKKASAEIIPGKLYFTSFEGPPPAVSDAYFCTIDNQLVYENFCLDFGPLNLGHTHWFCNWLDNLLNRNFCVLSQFFLDESTSGKVIVFYSNTEAKSRANAAVLIGSYSILSRQVTAVEAYEPLRKFEELYEPFHDASFFPCDFGLSVKDCLDGLYKAYKLKFFTWPGFNVMEYNHFCDLRNGDLNWLVEGKFVAFAGPFEERKHFGNGYYSTIPADYIPYFKQKNVTAVVRLNQACYNADHFTNAGFNHYDLFYPDGRNPPPEILKKFIEIAEKEKGALAVHCKAGLGRTGTCIGMYLMKHFDIGAREMIGYFRIARPGSVIGPQQDFLELNEERMKKEGEKYRKLQKKLKNKKNLKNIEPMDRSSFTSLVMVRKDEGMKDTKKKQRLDSVHVFSKVDNLRIDDEVDDEIKIDGIDVSKTDTQGDILNKLKAKHKKEKP